LVCSDWIVMAAYVAFFVLSHSLAQAAKVLKLIVCPMYIITAMLEGASSAQPGK